MRIDRLFQHDSRVPYCLYRTRHTCETLSLCVCVCVHVTGNWTGLGPRSHTHIDNCCDIVQTPVSKHGLTLVCWPIIISLINIIMGKFGSAHTHTRVTCPYLVWTILYCQLAPTISLGPWWDPIRSHMVSHFRLLDLFRFQSHTNTHTASMPTFILLGSKSIET